MADNRDQLGARAASASTHIQQASHDTAKKAEDVTSSIRDTLGEGVDRLKEQGREKLKEFKDITDRVQSQSSDAAEAVGDYIKDHPYSSIGIALLAGAALGLLMRN